MDPTDDGVKVHEQAPLERSHLIQLGGSILGNRAHICAFFNNPDDEYRVLLPFIKDGLACGEKAFHTVDPQRRDEHLQRLALAGIDVTALHRSGQFEVQDWTDTHLCDGQFDQGGTLALFQKVRKDAKQQGFPRVRFLTQMEWALETQVGIEALLEYEARANEAWLRQDGPVHPVICTYDLTKFSGEIIVDVMRTHPMIIIGGALQENPFFIPPDEFLRELRKKRLAKVKKEAISISIGTQTEQTVDEVKHLKTCINNLSSILALPALWTGHDASRVTATLLDVMVPMLDLDFAYARIVDPANESPHEWMRSADKGTQYAETHEVGRTLEPSLATETPSEGLRIANPVGEDTASIAVFHLGVQDRVGVFVAASRRSEFPTKTERLVLQVATNQAAVALQEARRIAQQDARIELERTRTKAMLQDSEERFRQMTDSIPEMMQRIMDSAPAHIHTALPDGDIDFFNQTWLRYVGLSLEHLQGWKWTVAIHPADVEGMVERWRASLASGEPFLYEARVRRADGQYRWMLHHKIAQRDEHGEIVKWYGASIDIEDRKRAEDEIQRLQDRLQRENIALREEVDKTSMFEEIVGASRALRGVLLSITKVAPTDSTVLITGETGTGKELLARAIHKRSRRSSHAFVSVNCAAIPQSLIASELFGHEKGAFTGALQRRLGRFELAQGGTIFLDEIGDLSADTQHALLRVLQEREFERVGGAQSIRANVRVIAATNRDLKAAMTTGAFRSDLFYRLNVFPIDIPPLRERREDIPLLVKYFIDRYASKAGKKIRSINKKSLELLQAYPWPGNIRELQNVIERSVIICETETLVVEENWLSHESVRTQSPSRPLAEELVAREKERIEAALAETRGRVSGLLGAAARLGIPPSTLDSKIRSLKINKHRFKTV